MKDFTLAVAIFATIAITAAVDEECIQRKIRGLPVHWPKPTGCASFYRCTNKNIKRELLCPEGKIYNPKTGRCANKGRSTCRLSLAAPSTDKINNICADKISGTFVPNPNSCRGFSICDNNLAYPQICPPGSLFNKKTSACEPDTKKICWENVCVNKKNGAFVPDADNCHNFYICYEENPTKQSCSENSYFNAESLNCQPGKCPGEETTTTKTTTTTTTQHETTTTCAPVTTSKTCTDATTTTCAPVTTSKTCTDATTTTTCAPKTTSKTCTTTTCAPETTTTTTCVTTTTTTTICTSKPTTITTTTCATKPTTTTCAAETTTIKCTAGTTTTTCSSQETTTPPNKDCTNGKCDTLKCQNAKDDYVFPARNTTAGFCVCLNQKPQYRQCPDEGVFNESLLICVAKDKACKSSKCLKQPDNITFSADNTTNGFCLCLNGQASYHACVGTDFVYNSTLGLCVKSNSATDCQDEQNIDTKLCKGGYSEGDFVANPDNCMLFYICYEGNLVESNCDTGNYFEDKIKACLPDSQKKCPTSHQVPNSINNRRNKRSIRSSACVEGSNIPAADCDKYYKCSGGHRLLYGCGKGSFFNVTTLACQLDVEHVCWPVNSCTEGEKNSDPEDDTKYYECVDGRFVAMSCGPNTVFRKLTKTCVAQQECTCPGGYKEGDISAHPTDCDKFYICTDGKQMLHECGEGNYFDKQTLSCEKDVEHICHIEKPCSCPGGYEDGELSTHPTDCDKYYICVNGKQILHECGEGNYFDNSTLTCEPDTNNECWTKQDCTCPGGYQQGEISAHPTECSKYYICHDGYQVLKDCGTNNYFDNDNLTCEPDVYHVCWPNLCAGRPNGALVANPQQCNAYFFCENNEATAKACYEGQWFDPKSSACVADLKAVCYNPCANENSGPVVLLPHPICNKYYFCNGHKTFVGTCQVGSFDIETGVCNKTKKCLPNPCDNPMVSVFPDPYDPTKFFWCNAEKQPIPYNCPNGTEFNLEFKMCKKYSDPDCPACSGDGYFPTLDKTKDNEFCVCVDNLATKIECPQDYVFNPELRACYSNAPCDPSFCLEAKEYDTAPNRNDSKSFCMCFNKKPIILNCPNNGTFNPYTLECSDYEISPECLQSTCVGETTNTYIFNPINTKTSNGFCQCINQIATFRPCNYGSTLNPDLLICQLAEINCNSYQCRGLPDKTIIPAVTTTEGYCECFAGVATYHNCPNNGEFNVKTRKCEAPLCDLTRCTAIDPVNPFPASIPNGFCICSIGYVPCQTEGTLFSDIFHNCLDPCPELLCDGKPDKYLVSSLISNSSFCVCHNNLISPTYESCPSESFVFVETEQRCVQNNEKLCGTELCKTPGPFEAKDTLTGFCLCTDPGKKPIFEKCLRGSYVPDKKACLPTAKDVCDISLCTHATIEHPITLPANNSISQFCYCSSPTDAMLLPCPYGKYYSHAKGMCISEHDDKCSCPNNVGEKQKVPDTTTCNKFSICVNGIMRPETCPVGDYFNVDINDCVPDTQGICIRKSDCKCLGIYYENELLPHPVNPQMYYACQGNTLHEYKCPAGRVFSANQKQCISNHNLRQKRSVDVDNEHEIEFGCLENEKRSVPSNCSQYEICLQQTWKRINCSNQRYYNPEQQKCLEPRDDFVCSYAKVTTLPTCNASMEYYLFKAKNCQYYYRCQSGKWRIKFCGRHHYFNTKISSCLPVPNDPFFKCELSNNSTNDKVETPSCQHLSQRFYVKNCAMYLICLENDWWYQYCPPGMYYNRTLNYCIRDLYQQCKDVRQAEVELDTEEFFQDYCQQDGLLRPSAIACNRYFVCLNGKWQIQHCSLGEFYDVAHAKCSLDMEGICDQLNKDCVPSERKSSPRNCSSYEQCSNEGKWLKMSCPQNEVYDDLLQQCIANMGICSKYGLKRTCKQNEIIKVPQNCSLFYYCSEDTWSLGRCLKGFMYSSEDQKCVAHITTDNCKPLSLKEMQSTEMSYTKKSSPCQGQMNGAWVAHPMDCSRYYICLRDSESQEMQCPRGSYFEPSLGYCRPNDGSCRLPLQGDCVNASDGSLVPHPSNCQAFYSCSSINGTELLYCAEGQYFDQHSRQCRIDQGECKVDMMPEQKCSGLSHGTRLAHETYCNIYYACVQALAFTVECPNNYRFNSTLSKCVPNKEHQCLIGNLPSSNATHNCGNLSDGSYFPNPNDCTRYYICLQGQALPKKCANSSYFDNEQLLCMPDDGSCPFVRQDEQQYNSAPPNPSICEGKHGDLMADPVNCNNFYVCIHNKLKHERCYSQQFFNTTSQQCQPKLLQESSISSNTSLDDSNTRAAKNKLPKCLDEITTVKGLCSEMSEGTSLAEPGDCRRYITCQATEEDPVRQRCRNGESFDSILGFCRQNDGTCLLENGQRVGECNGKHGQLVKDSSNCRGYFVCINGQKIVQTCKDNEYFSKTQNMCAKDTKQICKPTLASEEHVMQSCDGLSESVLYPYLHDKCRSYFQCIDGVPKIHKCADDLYFDSLEIKCIKNKTECVMPAQTLQRSPESSQTFIKVK